MGLGFRRFGQLIKGLGFRDQGLKFIGLRGSGLRV